MRHDEMAYKRRREFFERRKKIMAEWIERHPEGITAENLKEFQAFFKSREREIRSQAMTKEGK